MAEVYLTPEGKKELDDKLAYLKNIRRTEIAELISEARAQGDLSENAEYDAAKNEQAELEERISKLEYMMRNAKIISEDELTGEHVNLGLAVKVKHTKGKQKGQEEVFTIVGTNDADPFENKISNDSPIGKALLGRTVGETVEVQTAMGVLSYKIVEIIRD